MEWDYQRILKWLAISMLVCLAGWVIYVFSASEPTQVLWMQDKFVKALEKRKWTVVEGLISNDYADEWGQDAPMLKDTARQMLGSFIFLNIEQIDTTSRAAKGLGMAKSKFKIVGNGAGVSNLVMNEVNRLKEPWLFHWHKRGRWPWSWELVQIHNDQLRYGTKTVTQ